MDAHSWLVSHGSAEEDAAGGPAAVKACLCACCPSSQLQPGAACTLFMPCPVLTSLRAGCLDSGGDAAGIAAWAESAAEVGMLGARAAVLVHADAQPILCLQSGSLCAWSVPCPALSGLGQAIRV